MLKLSDKQLQKIVFAERLRAVSRLAGYYYDPLPEERPIIAPGATVGLRLTTAPTSFNATARIVWREIG
jgi:hypothetical protein